MAIEFELKYRATPEKLQAVRQILTGPEQTISMQTTYYDTPDGALAARHYTLRRRMEDQRSVCTLKIPAAGGGRGEFEILCQEITHAIPELCKLSGVADLVLLTASGVQPVCGAKFTRIAKMIQLEDARVELALDQGVLMGGQQQIPLCELEVELKEGSRQQAVAFAQKLAQTFDLIQEPASKFRRALNLAKGER